MKRSVSKAVNSMSAETLARLTPKATKQTFTVEKLKKFLPKGTSIKVSEDLVDELNKIGEGIDSALFEEQFLSHTTLLGKGISAQKLANAIKYVILVNVLQHTSEKAWMIVFPDKAQELLEQGRDASSFAAMYAGTKAVVEIQKKSILSAKFSMVPKYFRSLEVLTNLMEGNAANGVQASPTVQLNAAIAVEAALKPEEDTTINLNISDNAKAAEAQKSLADSLAKMAEAQMAKFAAGKSIDEAQKLNISFTDAEVIED